MSLRSCLLLLRWDLLRRGWAFIEARIVQELDDLGREHSLLDLWDHLHYPFLDHGLRRMLLLMLLLLLSVVYLIRRLNFFCMPLPLRDRPGRLFMGTHMIPSDLRGI